MNKLCKEYINEIKAIFPVKGNEERKYIKELSKDIEDYCEESNATGLVNICIVEKITKFDNDIFLDFRAAGKSFAGSTIRLRMACP